MNGPGKHGTAYQLRDYMLDIGNSTNGAIGLCAYTESTSRTAALEKFRKEIGEEFSLKPGVYSINVYLNWDKISILDIEEVERDDA